MPRTAHTECCTYARAHIPYFFGFGPGTLLPDARPFASSSLLLLLVFTLPNTEARTCAHFFIYTEWDRAAERRARILTFIPSQRARGRIFISFHPLFSTLISPPCIPHRLPFALLTTSPVELRYIRSRVVIPGSTHFY